MSTYYVPEQIPIAYGARVQLHSRYVVGFRPHHLEAHKSWVCLIFFKFVLLSNGIRSYRNRVPEEHSS